MVDKQVDFLKKNPESPRAWGLLGDAYMNLDKKFEARQAYKKALQFDPEDHYAKNGLAELNEYKNLNL